MHIVGLSAFYHDAACCLLKNGNLVAAASEERFTRVKHDPRLPVHAFRYCLEEGGIDITEIDAVAWYEMPVDKVARQLWAGMPKDRATDFAWFDPRVPERAIRQRLGFQGPIHFFPHHLSHAASSFFFSGFEEAAVFTVDGVGEWATTSYGRGSAAGIELFDEVHFPHSLGLLYATITAYLGFKVNDGEYKVMGLAPYGTPRLVEKIRNLVSSLEKGQFRLDMRFFDFVRGQRMYSEALCDLLGRAPRQTDEPIQSFHQDVAYAVQKVLEEILLEKVGYLREFTNTRNLCMAGGVALNCVANGRILRESGFEKLFVQPAAGDAGTALGAAALAHHKLAGQFRASMDHAFWGPAWHEEPLDAIVHATGLPFKDYRGSEANLLEAVVQRLAAGKIVGWFQGRAEWGPRALGARSILANPLMPETKEHLNNAIKKRESFRPFAPSVLLSQAKEHFDLDQGSPFMLEVCQVSSELELPGITHVDGSARPQTVDPETAPRFAALIQAFQHQTGCPLLVNTSFNVANEPVVNSPADALFCFANAGLDCLVMGDFLLDRNQLPEGWVQRCRSWHQPVTSPFAREKNAINEHLYTFV